MDINILKRWVETSFDCVPTTLIERAYRFSYEEIEILASPYDCQETPIIPYWGYVYLPSIIYHDKIIENAGIISKKAHFIIYYTEDLGVYLGIHGGGYDFYEKHWLPLYEILTS